MTIQQRQPAGTPVGGQYASTGRPAATVALVDVLDDEVVASTTWYHGSFHEITDGDTLHPGAQESNFAQSDAGSVSLTSEPDRALAWARDAARTRGLPADTPVYVYAVKPVGPVRVWRQRPKNYGRDIAYDEVRAGSAEVAETVFGKGRLSVPGKQHIYDAAGLIVESRF